MKLHKFNKNIPPHLKQTLEQFQTKPVLLVEMKMCAETFKEIKSCVKINSPKANNMIQAKNEIKTLNFFLLTNNKTFIKCTVQFILYTVKYRIPIIIDVNCTAQYTVHCAIQYHPCFQLLCYNVQSRTLYIVKYSIINDLNCIAESTVHC